MGCPVRCTVLLSLLWLLCASGVWSQDIRERDALCNEEGCFVLYFQRKIFLDSWRSCKDKGGNLATVKRQEEADTIAALFSSAELRSQQSRVRVWIGLQRQPRQCSAARPLRGFSWTTGDQDTEYTNWLRVDSPITCSAPRCVVMSYGTTAKDIGENFKWQDGPCSIPVDGYLCRYTYKGMCPAIRSEGGGNTLYSTPFNLLSSLLTYAPFGSVATVPCPVGSKEEQSVLCMKKEDGSVGWSRDTPLCSDAPKESWCDQDNGGCHHYCMEVGEHHYCECSEGYILTEDGQSCFQADPCHGAPCEFECLPVMDSYRCACPEGYMLAPDERGCLDVDECLQSPCEQLCVNAPGTFECRCHAGFRPDEEGMCNDVDECMEDPCEHACENTPGSHVCHCLLGFSPLPEDPSRCHDIDECQIPGTCEQMCINNDGGFECYCEVGYELLPDHYSCNPISDGQEPDTATPPYPWVTSLPDTIWDPQGPVFSLTREPDTDWPTDQEPLDWLTDPPNMETLPPDLLWLTNVPQEEPDPTPAPERLAEDVNLGWDVLETPTPNWYEDESTTIPSAPPSSTVGGGAWNWLWYSSTPAEQEQGATVWQTFTVYGEPEPTYDQGEDGHTVQTSSPLLPVLNLPDVEDYATKTDATLESHTTSLPLTPLIPDQGIEDPSKNGSSQQQGGSWLLVALLVPLSIFVVVMVALGIVYCTRCAAQQRNKSATDCYHWISGAGDKAGGDMGAGTKSHV